ncbi:MAG TPA: xanthine dehydrogenase family protein subunit M [Candidatus Limnocylindrales bacterium]|jgi:carbon-monoxide dehydrogenase medium subunit
MRTFAYARPATLADAVALLAEHGPGARPLAGGTDLIIRLRDRSLQPDVVVDVKGIAELDDGIRQVDDRVVIGARAVMTDIAADPLVRRHFPALVDAAMVVGAVQIRNRATLAGNICNASPAADTAPALLVHEASVVVAGPSGTRRIAVDDLWVRSGVTTLAPGELVTAIELPVPPGRQASVHLRRTRRRGHDLAAVTLACLVSDDGPARIAYGSVGPRPVVVSVADGTLTDPGATPEARLEALDRVFAAASPSATSMRASPEYRLAMLRVLGLRAIDAAIARLAASA